MPAVCGHLLYKDEGQERGLSDGPCSIRNPCRLPSDASAWHTDRLTDEAVRAIQSCRKHGRAAAKHAWQAGAYLSLLHARLVKGRRWAAWLRRHEEVVSEDTARRYILLHERTGGRAAELDGMTLTEAYAAFGITRFTEVAPAEPELGTGKARSMAPGGSEADLRRRPSHDTPPSNGTNGKHHHLFRAAGLAITDVEDPDDLLAGLDEKAILRAARPRSASGRSPSGSGGRGRSRSRRRAGRNGKRTWVDHRRPEGRPVPRRHRRPALRDQQRAVGARRPGGIHAGVVRAVVEVRGRFRGDLLEPGEAV